MPASSDERGTAVDDDQDLEQPDVESASGNGAAGEKPPLTMEVTIDKTGACQRHIAVSISAEDVARYFDEKFSELVPEAKVPGFRPGRAPRKLIESRFRKEVSEQVKAALLMDSLAQINEDYEIAAISEPEFDLDAVEVPDEGPMVFEFDLEVRPEFDLPNWKGLRVDRPTYAFTEKDVERRMKEILSRHAHMAPYDGPAEDGDQITCNLTFRHEGEVVTRANEVDIVLRPVLSLRDANVKKFNELMRGVKIGETRIGKATLTNDAPNEALRGKELDAEFHVLDIKRIELPELTPDLLDEIGYEDEASLREAVRKDLERRLEYHQKQVAREQITAALTKDAHWELPESLLKRQAQRELERRVLELRRSGFSDPEIKAYINQIRQNSMASTAKALKEHFILERIAEDENLEADEADFEAEILLIAYQSGESVRKVRARLEKRGLIDVLRNQVIERKVIERVLEHATYNDVPFQPDAGPETEALDQSAGGGDRGADIPEAKKAEAGALPGSENRE